MKLVRRLLLVLGLTLLALFAAGFVAGRATAHEPYTNWHVPGNPASSCCSNADCRPTRAYLTDDGWRAWNGETWLLVPWERVLPTDLAGDGRTHLCSRDSFVYCFSPGEPRI